ncbi:calcium-binding protein [Egbenema bharatensis]|uniref:calcium-binding protein n=1 Tax=Egbenema bharatensis TaxID=3463334 RepID=UPI003A89C26C
MATILGTSGADTLLGTAGDDIILADAGADYIYVEFGNNLIDAGAGNDYVEAGDGNDTINGGNGNDTVFGGEGNDSILGGLGNDVLYGDGGNDVLQGEAGDDYLDGGAGDDILLGDAGNDTLIGGLGSDFLSGGEGDDVINSHEVRRSGRLLERDEMYGGAGTNTFNLFTNYSGGRRARTPAARPGSTTGDQAFSIIWDFKVGEDELNLLNRRRDYTFEDGNFANRGARTVADTFVTLQGNLVAVIVDARVRRANVGQVGFSAPSPDLTPDTEI